jgi:hypothetical protein
MATPLAYRQGTCSCTANPSARGHTHVQVQGIYVCSSSSHDSKPANERWPKIVSRCQNLKHYSCNQRKTPKIPHRLHYQRRRSWELSLQNWSRQRSVESLTRAGKTFKHRRHVMNYHVIYMHSLSLFQIRASVRIGKSEKDRNCAQTWTRKTHEALMAHTLRIVAWEMYGVEVSPYLCEDAEKVRGSRFHVLMVDHISYERTMYAHPSSGVSIYVNFFILALHFLYCAPFR